MHSTEDEQNSRGTCVVGSNGVRRDETVAKSPVKCSSLQFGGIVTRRNYSSPPGDEHSKHDKTQEYKYTTHHLPVSSLLLLWLLLSVSLL